MYVLKLRGGRFYVGTSSDVGHRITVHFDGRGAEWTKKYPPVDVELIEEGVEDPGQREREVYERYVEAYGEERVRGAHRTDSGGSA